jgi:hypothetical protein
LFSDRNSEPREEPIMPDYGGWMWLVIDVAMVAVLAAALFYGIGMWRRRYRDRATQEVRDEGDGAAVPQRTIVERACYALILCTSASDTSKLA